MRHLCRCVPLRRHFFGIKKFTLHLATSHKLPKRGCVRQQNVRTQPLFVTSKKISTIKPRNARSFQRVITLQKCNCLRNDSRKKQKQATAAAMTRGKSKQLPPQKVPALRSSPTFPSLMKTLFHSSADLSRLDSRKSRPAASCPEQTLHR